MKSFDSSASHANVYSIALVGVLGAVSAVLMAISIPLPFAPSFLRFDISELPALFTGFFLGPLSGGMVVIIKNLLKLLMQGTDTAFVGESMNIVGSLCFVLPAARVYRLNRTTRGAIGGMLLSTVGVSIVCIFLNAYVAFPLYSRLYGLPMEDIVQMGSSVNPLIHDEVSLMAFGVFPFNLLKHGFTSVCTYLVYKRCGNALRSVLMHR